MQDKITTKEAENVNERAAVAPRVDVYENEHEFLLLADLPGVSKSQLHIDVQEDELAIEGRRGDAPKHEPLVRESRDYDFRRTFVLPQGVDYSKIDAALSNGVLTLKLPKAEAIKPRKIEVRAG